MTDEKEQRSQEDSRKGLVIAVTIFAVVLIAAVLAYNALAPEASQGFDLQRNGSSSQATSDGAKVPAFTVTDAAGETVSIRQFEGEPVVLNFWASTCGPCQSEMPHFQAAYEKLGAEVRFVMVDIPGFNGETIERAERFLQSNGYTFPAYFDAEADASRAFAITSIPRTYFIDANGSIVASASGALSQQSLAQGLEMLGVS